MSSDEDDTYEIERILAEKTNDEGEHVYLVKWDGYPDEECTWEPADHFDHPEALQEWSDQKARGDTLDQYDVQRIQDQIDAFWARQDNDAEDESAEDGNRSSASPMDVDESEERPRKRVKLVRVASCEADLNPLTSQVPDAPLLTKKGTARPMKGSMQRKAPELTKASTVSGRLASLEEQPSKPRLKPAAPALHRPTAKTTPISKPASAPLHAPSRAPEPSRPASGKSAVKLTSKVFTIAQSGAVKTASAKSLPQQPAKSVQNEPQKFYGPEIRTRAPSDKPIVRDNTGKRFNNYQHMNNVRKKMREERPPPSPPRKTKADDKPSGQQSVEEAQSPAQQHASDMFFGPYDDEEDRQRALDQSAAMSPIVHYIQESTLQERMPAGSVQTSKLSSEQPATNKASAENPAVQTRPLLTVNTVTPDAIGTADDTTTFEDRSKVQEAGLQRHSSLGPISAHSSATSQAHPLNTKRSKPSAETDTAAGAVLTHGLPHAPNPPQSSDIPLQEGEIRPRPRRNSLFNRNLPSSTVTDHPRDESLRQRSPPREPLRPLPPTTVRGPPAGTTWSGLPTAAAKNFVSHGEMQRASNGRVWQKGDVILELYLDNHDAGGIKLLHVPWNYAKPIVALKQGPLLPVAFGPTISRLQYERLAKSRWFSYTAIGAVEPFPETAAGIASLADYLEQWDIAGLWEHPDEDIMLILYSCRSLSWRDVGQKPVRNGESRLHIAFRRKLQEPGPSMETLARIVEQGARIEEEEQARGREAQRRAQTSEQRDASRRGRSSSRRRVETVNPRREARRPRSTSRRRSKDADERRGSDDRGRTSRRASIASAAPVRPHIESRAQPTGTLPSPALQSPSVQLLHDLQMSMTPQLDGGTSDDAMEVDVQSPQNHNPEPSKTTTSSTVSTDATKTTVALKATTTTTGTITTPSTETPFAGLERGLEDFSWSPDLPKVDKSRIFVMLAYKQVEPERVSHLTSWLISTGLPSDQIFDKSVSGDWAKLSRRIEDSVCVILFDRLYPFIILDGLAKWLERENLICWEIDYRAKGDTPLQMTKLFPRGRAIAISEGCFIHEPSATLSVLKWFKAKASVPVSSSKLMTPPGISFILQEQAVLARKESSKNQYLDMARLLQQMSDMNDHTDASDSGFGEVNSLNFSVVKPTWSEVYKDIPESDEKLSAIEAKERDEEKDDKLLQYFAAWAARHTEDHRRFIALIMDNNMGKKPKNIEHVRLQLIKGFADKFANPKASRPKERQGSRDQSRARPVSAMSTPRS
ncbi:hypothetical protein OHC33_009133 [Knufia fluminis]|uniref:Chromo domain-containing protein n=1 Tax=Knufia fluminis TaxID=191047 RepID=A0AAN8I318_9EURO|nr:hypothetical protein OHC33_009133 [Knufia fluminis]